MLLQFAGVFGSREGAGGKRFCCSPPQKKACTVLFVKLFWTDCPATVAGGCGLNPVGPMTGGSFAQNHSTFTRDHRPKLKTVPAAYFHEDVMPTSCRPLSWQSADDGSPLLLCAPLSAGGTTRLLEESRLFLKGDELTRSPLALRW